MKTLTPEQREQGFTELEGVIGEGGVGGAHLMSFLAGIAHAEKVLGEEPKVPFVRLTDEEVERLMSSALVPKEIDERDLNYFARAIEDALEEKNK